MQREACKGGREGVGGDCVAGGFCSWAGLEDGDGGRQTERRRVMSVRGEGRRVVVEYWGSFVFNIVEDNPGAATVRLPRRGWKALLACVACVGRGEGWDGGAKGELEEARRGGAVGSLLS